MSDTPLTLDVADGFGPVADAFRANFAAGEELGAQFCVRLHGKVVVDLVGGWRDRKRTEAMQADDLVAVFSSGKAVAALVVALCVERGELDYDAPLTTWWPEFGAQGKADITLAQALSHQAGLPGITNPDWTPSDWLDWTKTCAELASQAPLFPPGSASGYHPVTYGFLAGEPVRRATGRTLGEILREDFASDVFIGTDRHERTADMRKPSGVADFGEITPTVRAAFFMPWSSPGGAGAAAWREAELAGSNCHATARGLAEIMGVALDGRLRGERMLSEATLETFREPRISGRDLVLPFELTFAAGVMRNSPNFNYGPNAATVGHSGWGGSCVWADPDAKVSGAYAMTRQSPSLMGDPRSLRLIEALYACL